MNWKLDPQLLAVFQESCDDFSKLEQAALLTQWRTSRVIRLIQGSFKFHTFHFNCHRSSDQRAQMLFKRNSKSTPGECIFPTAFALFEF